MSSAKPDTREQTTIRLPAELKTKIQQQADKKGYSFNMAVVILLRKALEAESDR